MSLTNVFQKRHYSYRRHQHHPIATTTTYLTKKITVLVSTKSSHPPRFQIPSSYTSSSHNDTAITLHLPQPSSTERCRNSNNRDCGGGTPTSPKTAQNSYNYLAILKSHHNNNKHNNNNNNNNNTVSATHTQEKSISSPHSNRSSILCHNFVSNSPVSDLLEQKFRSSECH